MNPIAEMALGLMTAEQLRRLVHSLHVELVKREVIAETTLKDLRPLVMSLEALKLLLPGISDETVIVLIAPNSVGVNIRAGDLRKAFESIRGLKS